MVVCISMYALKAKLNKIYGEYIINSKFDKKYNFIGKLIASFEKYLI